MESGLKELAEELSAGPGADKQFGILQSMIRVVQSNDSIQVEPQVFEQVVEVALQTSHTGVRYGSMNLLAPLLEASKSPRDLLDERLLNLCFKMVSDANVMVLCLKMLVVALERGDQSIVELAVKKGVIDTLFRLYNTEVPQAARDVVLKGFFALSSHRSYCLRMHEKDIWTLFYLIYEVETVNKLMLMVIKNVVMSLSSNNERTRPSSVKSVAKLNRASSSDIRGSRTSRTSRRSKRASTKGGDAEQAPENAHEQQEKEEQFRRSVQRTKNRLSQNLSRNLGGREGLIDSLLEDLDSSLKEADEEKDNLEESPEDQSAASPRLKENPDYSEDEGLLDDRFLEESDLTLQERICFKIDRTGIMGMLLSICQMNDLEALADLCLSILGFLTPTMHRVISRDKRIVIVRVLLNSVDFTADSRLISVAFVLDSLLAQRGSRSIVLSCGTAPRCAATGLKLIHRKDQTSKSICQCLVQLLYHISTLPDGPLELSNPGCISFLTKSMKSIASTKLRKNHKGKEEWSSNLEVICLLTLINIALETPVMSSVSEAHVHKALSNATKRTDELGLLAVLGSAFFVGKSNHRTRSREIPKLQLSMTEKLVELIEETSREEPSLGGIYWSLQELLLAINFLAQAPHNLFNLRAILPLMVTTLRTHVDRGDADVSGLAVEILLLMSYNKHIMKEMIENYPDLLQLLEASLPIVPYECVRSTETLIVSVENETALHRNDASTTTMQDPEQPPMPQASFGPRRTSSGSGSLRGKLTSLTKGSLKRLSFRKSLSRQFSSSSSENNTGYLVTDPLHQDE